MEISKSNKQMPLTLSGDSLPASVRNKIGSLKNASFPCKVHFLLCFASDYGFEDIISWLPCGTAFVVHDSYRLSQVLLPLLFPGMASFMSFRRQLNMHGIKVQNNKQKKKKKEQQQSSSPRTNKATTTKGVFSHPLLIRSNPSNMCLRITRNQISLSSRLKRIKRRTEQQKQKSLDMSSLLQEESLGGRLEASTYVYPSTIPAAHSSENHDVSLPYNVLGNKREGMVLLPEGADAGATATAMTTTTAKGDVFFCSAADIEAEIISTFHQHNHRPAGGQQQQSVVSKLWWLPGIGSTSYTTKRHTTHHLALDTCLGFFHPV